MVDIDLRQALADAISRHPGRSSIVKSLSVADDGTGHVTYNMSGLWVDPKAPGFTNGRTRISDEELVRVYLLCQLATVYRYQADQSVLEVERVFAPVGRPGKGGRIDVVVRDHGGTPASPAPAFLFIECKAPSTFDRDMKYLDGQLFRLSRQEAVRPRYLVYYTVELKSEGLRERLVLIDTVAFPDYTDWDAAGQPITDTIPASYGAAAKRQYANVQAATEWLQPLDVEASQETFNRLRAEIHDVIWGGGGTSNNEVFVLITKLMLCKIYDEKETNPGLSYRFQRRGDAIEPEASADLCARLNDLYREAERAYLALEADSQGPAFDTSRVAEDKIAYVVGRLEGLSVTENLHTGDLLGEFFEQIVSQDFTQSKGQFFTPVKIVRFMLELVDAEGTASNVMLHDKDHLGRPRLPYVIDPSCGSGTFLIEYMKLIRRTVGRADTRTQLPRRVREAHETWFSGATGNAWARDFLFGVENNYDLGLAAKVNMVLHGDGSMNTWIKSGLSPFADYWVDGRHNLLGTVKERQSGYEGELNEQFDFIISNPPFSLSLSPDEKKRAAATFDIMRSAKSEAIFIERWYQLLREGGRFCCILPEAVLDVASAASMRRFLVAHFKVLAVISLPYDAFKPFTGTKTAILFAEKRQQIEIDELNAALTEIGANVRNPSSGDLLLAADQCGWLDDHIFMAEPRSVGYKRRKNLPDLDLRNDLYAEDRFGQVSRELDQSGTVLGSWQGSSEGAPSLPGGFHTSLRAVCGRDDLRLDPKYRWLWDHEDGVVYGRFGMAEPLSTFLGVVDQLRVKKGELVARSTVVDLEHVESRQAILRPDLPVLDVLGSDKICFGRCDLAISRLEPYLAKVVLAPQEEWLGSQEWVSLEIRDDTPPLLVAYLLMLPSVREGYRRLQSGKRHARMDPEDFLRLRVEVPRRESWPELVGALSEKRRQILALREEQQRVRGSIDDLLRI